MRELLAVLCRQRGLCASDEEASGREKADRGTARRQEMCLSRER